MTSINTQTQGAKGQREGPENMTDLGPPSGFLPGASTSECGCTQGTPPVEAEEQKSSPVPLKYDKPTSYRFQSATISRTKYASLKGRKGSLYNTYANEAQRHRTFKTKCPYMYSP